MKKLWLFALLFAVLFASLPTASLPQAAAATAGEDLFASATWEKGSFYATAAPDTTYAERRRYTVIPCEPGDIFQVVKPTADWKIYAYPADAEGSIDGTWVELKNDEPYRITPINGRTPTALRITACPSPDQVITDVMWDAFDVSCFVEKGTYVPPETPTATNDLFATAQWKLGSYYGNAVHGGAERRHAVFPCQPGDTFTFDFADTTYGLWVYYYNADGEIADFGYTAVTKDTEIKIAAKNGKLPTELRISVYPVAGGTITDSMWEEFNVVCTRASDYIRVATMNYGLWNDGITKYVADEQVETVLAAWKQMLDDNDPDILAGQECLEYFDRSNTMTAAEHVFGYKYLYQQSSGAGSTGKNMVSKTPLTDYKVTAHTQNTNRTYATAYTVINGKKICLINAHLSTESDVTVNRAAEYQDLLKVMEREEYVIVFGDFNAYTTAEFNVFKQAGYTVVNGDAFGTFDTWTNFDKPSTWTNKAIDNIIVSANITVLDARVDRRDLSDHSMLLADIYVGEAPAPKMAPIKSVYQYVGGGEDHSSLNGVAEAGSAVYRHNGALHTAFRVPASYVTDSADFSTILLDGVSYPITERGILLGTAGKAMTVDSAVKVSSTDFRNKYWTYDAATGTVTYTALVKNVKQTAINTAYIARAYVKILADGVERVVYSDVSVAFTPQDLYNGTVTELAAQGKPAPRWFTNDGVDDGYVDLS